MKRLGGRSCGYSEAAGTMLDLHVGMLSDLKIVRFLLGNMIWATANDMKQHNTMVHFETVGNFVDAG